jgi:hypothetical protein
MENTLFCDVALYGHVRTHHLEERVASISRMERVHELLKTLAVTCRRSSETSVLTNPTRRHFLEDSILHAATVSLLSQTLESKCWGLAIEK